MRFTTRWIACLRILAIATWLAVGTIASSQETIPGWHPNLEEARKQAAATGKPLFITFRCVR